MNQKPNDLTESGSIHSTIRWGVAYFSLFFIFWIVHLRFCGCPNCINTHLYRGGDDVRAVMVEERWVSDEHVMEHLRSEAYRRILLVMEMAEEPPEIFFDVISNSTGIEKIETARRNRSVNVKQAMRSEKEKT